MVENPNRISEHPGKQRASLGGIILVKTNPLAGKLDDRAEPVSRSRHGRAEERTEGKAIRRGKREGGIRDSDLKNWKQFSLLRSNGLSLVSKWNRLEKAVRLEG